ncbi:ABC transporter ATP-binding protein [Streptomyces sp. NPDC087903]|uniref:ABC transporter ATP-binding protein n=1 Tax=Streptomyces sp. NPDC087903 TaxID=3365819 RepID=UPI00382F2B9A
MAEIDVHDGTGKAGVRGGGVRADALTLRSVSRWYRSGGGRVTALDEVSLAFAPGTFTAVMGPSGSGKSTLLQCAAGLDRPDAGSVRLGDTELTKLGERRLTLLRRERIGFVFQAYNLLPSLTAAQNVALPLRLAGRRPPKARVREVLRRVGLDGRAGHRPSQLSGGQQQRVALARALITRPEVLFGDEPTGALDSRTGREVLTLLREMVDSEGRTVVMVTHDPVAASYADRVVFLVDGRVHGELAGASAGEIAERTARWETGGAPRPTAARTAGAGPASPEAVSC